MNWQEMVPPDLSGLSTHLTLEKVLIDRDATKMLVCFLSDVLVEETDYLNLRKALQKAFLGMRVSLRVCSPALADDVRKNLPAYIPFITSFLVRSQPGIRPWLKDAIWQIENDRMVVSICSEAALRYVRHIDMDKKLVALMQDVFRMNVEAVIICEEDVQAQRERLRELEEKAQETVRQQMEAAMRDAKPKKKMDDKIYGRIIKDKTVPISTLKEDSGNITICGELVNVETRETRDGSSRMLIFGMTD